jgi:hypothetical protein
MFTFIRMKNYIFPREERNNVVFQLLFFAGCGSQKPVATSIFDDRPSFRGKGLLQVKPGTSKIAEDEKIIRGEDEKRSRCEVNVTISTCDGVREGEKK